MNYTVNQLAKIAGVTTRTLHYYDQIGLLKPSTIQANGYRCYEEKELLKLQQILFFKELEFSLEDIITIVNATNFNPIEALKDQKKLLEFKKYRVQSLLSTLDKTIKKLEGGEIMTNDDLFASFSDEQMKQYQEEAKQRWGNTEAWKQSQERTKHWTKADYDRIKKDGEAWTKKMAAIKEQGFTPQSPEAQAMIDQHYNGLRTFYEPNLEMYRGLGQMYVDDPRFTAYYDKHAKGLAIYMRDAMVYYVEQHQ